jgi:hypothetical protein
LSLFVDFIGLTLFNTFFIGIVFIGFVFIERAWPCVGSRAFTPARAAIAASVFFSRLELAVRFGGDPENILKF